MITTRESINYQFSLIFGYSSPKEIVVGDVIGPGNLTIEKVKDLTNEVIKFLRMYNAILRDFAGSEVFSIEFNLYNYDEKDASIKIYPKSMILIPGRYKDCESLLLALKPETGYLDTHQSRESLINISKLFFEVEEFTDRPELERNGKEQILKIFSNRFSQKLFGELVEDKWNKKLIGLSTSLPTEKEMLSTYATIKSDMEILWYKRPYEINMLNPKFEKGKSPFKGSSAIEHLKYSITEPSANFIIDNTLKLGTNLMNLANTGTIDESQDGIVSHLIKRIKNEIEKEKEPKSADWLISNIEKLLNELDSYLKKFLEYTNDFLSTGEMGDLATLMDKYLQYITEKGRNENVDFEEICNIAINSIKQSMIQKIDLRVIELSSVVNYISEVIRNSLKLLREILPNYFSRRRLKTITYEFIKNLKEEFDKEQKPAKILGHRFLDKFQEFLINQVEIDPILLSRDLKFNENKLIGEFKELVNNGIETFFENLELEIGDLVSFAEIMMQQDYQMIDEDIQNFKKFSSELHYLLSYILRYSTINRYLKDEPDKEIADPVSFANRFHRFLEKRVGGIKLVWKSYILEWIEDYAKKFFKGEDKKEWSLKEIYNDFIGYLEDRESSERDINRFFEFLDEYIAKTPDEKKKKLLIEFFKQYEFCIEIKAEFPNYLKEKIKNGIDTINLQSESLIPLQFFSVNEEDTFYNFIKESELKYFSKLIPRPISLILKHNLTIEEKEQFNGDLFHVLKFRFWHDSIKIDIADNFKEVYREWVKDL